MSEPYWELLGAVGPAGPAGAPGAAEGWYSGNGAPSAGLGANGDWYLDTTPGSPYLTSLPYGTSLPGSPVDGQEAILVDSVTNPTYQWRFRYNAGSSSAYKWEFIGGSDAMSSVITAEATTTTGSWLDLTTVGPRVILPRAGDYIAEGTAYGQHTVATAGMWISVAQNATAGSWGMPVSAPFANQAFAFATSAFRFNGCAASDDLRLRYYNAVAGTAQWAARWIRVRPVRVA